LAGEKKILFLCTVQRKGLIHHLKKGVQAAASDGRERAQSKLLDLTYHFGVFKSCYKGSSTPIQMGLIPRCLIRKRAWEGGDPGAGERVLKRACPRFKFC
jgi:hypothetical protein